MDIGIETFPALLEKPCPFCGTRAYNLDEFPDDIFCEDSNCLMFFYSKPASISREKLREFWNTRKGENE